MMQSCREHEWSDDRESSGTTARDWRHHKMWNSCTAKKQTNKETQQTKQCDKTTTVKNKVTSSKDTELQETQWLTTDSVQRKCRDKPATLKQANIIWQSGTTVTTEGDKFKKTQWTVERKTNHFCVCSNRCGSFLLNDNSVHKHPVLKHICSNVCLFVQLSK